MDRRHVSAYNAGMKSIQYTIRSIPESLDRILRLRAEREHKSLNAVVLEALEMAVQNEAEPKTHHDLDHLIGAWVEDPEFDAVMKSFERIDPDMWR